MRWLITACLIASVQLTDVPCANKKVCDCSGVMQGEKCDLNCNLSANECEGSTLQCAGDRDCEIVCQATNSCKDATIKTQGKPNEVVIRCNSDGACSNTTVDCEAGECSLICQAPNACKDVTMNCGRADKCRILCTADGSCAGLSVSCSQDCAMTCWKGCSPFEMKCPGGRHASPNTCMVKCENMLGPGACATGTLVGPVSVKCAPNACDQNLIDYANSNTCVKAPTMVPPAVFNCTLPAAKGQTCGIKCPGDPLRGVKCLGPDFDPVVPSCVTPLPLPTPTSTPTLTPTLSFTATETASLTATLSLPVTSTVTATISLTEERQQTVTQTVLNKAVGPSITTTIIDEKKKPKLPVSEKEKELTEDVSKAVVGVGAVSAITGAGGSGLANTGKLALLRNFFCNVEDLDLEEDEQLDFEFHPSTFPVGSTRQKYLMAAYFMNPSIVLASLCLTLTVAALFKACSDMVWDEALGLARAPGFAYVSVLFLMQGTSLVCAKLAFHSSMSHTGPGLIGLAVCMAVPPVIYVKVLRTDKSMQVIDPRTGRSSVNLTDDTIKPLTGWKKRLYIFLFGSHIWVSRGKGYHAEKYGNIFETYKEDCTWFGPFELMEMVLLSIGSAWVPTSTTECNIRNALISFVLVIFFCILCYKRPYESPLDNVWSGLIAGFMALAVILMTIGIAFSSTTTVLYHIAGKLLMLCFFMVLVKTITDVMIYFYDIKIGRRRTVRASNRASKTFEGSELARLAITTPLDEALSTPLLVEGSKFPGKRQQEDATCIITVQALDSSLSSGRASI